MLAICWMLHLSGIRCQGRSWVWVASSPWREPADLALELLEDGIHGCRITVHRGAHVCSSRKLLELVQGFAGLLCLVAVGLELEVGIESAMASSRFWSFCAIWPGRSGTRHRWARS